MTSRPPIADGKVGGGGGAGRSPNDLAECLDVIADYHDLIDRGHALAALQHVAEEVNFAMRGQHMNRQELEDFLTAREQQTDRLTYHSLIGQRLEASRDGETVVAGRALIYAWNERGFYELERILNVTHVLVRSGDRWLIAKRTSSPLHHNAVRTMDK